MMKQRRKMKNNCGDCIHGGVIVGVKCKLFPETCGIYKPSSEYPIMGCTPSELCRDCPNSCNPKEGK